jgi:hypothetical protein
LSEPITEPARTKGTRSDPSHADDPRARAKARTAQLLENGALEDTVDNFYVDPNIVPDGWVYEWKRVETLGKEDPSYQVQIDRAGWEPVPASRHPSYMPLGKGFTSITRDGMMLMERPKEIVDAARKRDQRAARDQVRQKEEQLGAAPPGTFERAKDGKALVNVKREFERGLEIPD